MGCRNTLVLFQNLPQIAGREFEKHDALERLNVQFGREQLHYVFLAAQSMQDADFLREGMNLMLGPNLHHLQREQGVVLGETRRVEAGERIRVGENPLELSLNARLRTDIVGRIFLATSPSLPCACGAGDRP